MSCPTRIYFTVTNDLSYDQRMHRICRSLSEAGFDIMLVGRKLPNSRPLQEYPFRQKRINCFFRKGPFFYFEYNLRLFLFLLFKPMEGICAIDLDTILPVYFISIIKGIPRIYDAHELFCEMKEIVDRPKMYRFWKRLEQFALPRFKFGYTVNQPIAHIFKKNYGVDYAVIRNMPFPYSQDKHLPREKFILYQGAVNEGRCFEKLIPAIRNMDMPLVICGDGNFKDQAKKLTSDLNLEDKIIFKGMLPPEVLRKYSQQAMVGITLFEKTSLNNFHSLANRFFDYIQAGTPQLCMNYPSYKEINDTWQVAHLIDDPTIDQITAGLHALTGNADYWKKLHDQCILAGTELNWNEESKKLIAFYQKIFGKASTYRHP